MKTELGNLLPFFLGLSFIFTIAHGAECRGSEVDSSGRSWIELNRPLPAEDLNYISVRFCRAQPILLQIWEPLGLTRYKLLWQRELRPDESYLGQVQVFPVPEPFTLNSTYRYGISATGNFPVETVFDGDHRMGRISIYSEEDGTFSAGEIREFSELSRPVYFHVWFCKNRECPSEEELLLTYEKELGTWNKEVIITEVPPDPCRTASLHPAGGRVMLEEHNTFLPSIARGVEFYLCDDTMFDLQLWEPTDGSRQYKQIWSKQIIPDGNSGGGYRRVISFSEEEVVYLQPFYRLALHVPDENKRIPIPSIFSYVENVVFSERKKEKFHRCDSQLFEEVAFPYNFRIRFCSTTDCSEGEETWTSDNPSFLDALPSIDCPEVIPEDLPDTTSQNNENNAKTVPTEAVDTDTTDGEDEDDDDRDINRTKITDGAKTPENDLQVPPNPKKSSSSANSVILHINLVVLTLGCWLALFLFT